MKKIKVSVGELAHTISLCGDLSFHFAGATRAAEGVAAHRKVQESRANGYQREVPVSYQVALRGFLFEITGRMDGIYQLEDRTVIEEIKSTHRSLDDLKVVENPLHLAQLKIYAYIYVTSNNLSGIEGQLTYYHLGSSAVRSFSYEFTAGDLETFFEDAVSRYLERAQGAEKWDRIRNESIWGLQFPFEAYRPGQRGMSEAVYATVKNSERLVLQAATGIGKTMAVVLPAIKALSEGFTSKIFYLTARTTVRTVAEGALDELRDKGLRIRSVTLTAKEKICFKRRADCSPAECEFGLGYYDRLDTALRGLERHEAFTRDLIEEIAAENSVCPFEFSLDLSIFTDFIICDYNYAFDPNVYLRRFFLDTDGDYLLLIDEAHNLVDRSREMFSAELQKQVLLETRRPLRKDLPDIFRNIGKINSWFLEARKECEASGGFQAQQEAPLELYPELENFLKTADRWLAMNIDKPYRKKLLDFYYSVRGFLKIARQYDDAYVNYYQKKGSDLQVRLFCLDASNRLEKLLDRCRAAVFFSATMTPPHYFKETLGGGDLAQTLVIPSSFPQENLCLLIADRISILYKNRQKTKHEVTRMMASLINGKPGNYMVYFPSYAYLKMIWDEFVITNSHIETIVQVPGMKESERDRFLTRFSEDNHGTLVGFAVMGGIFGEGIDLAGERLCGAVIVGVGLPAFTPERELIRQYHTENQQPGYEFAYVYPGLNRVLQAAGRVVRSENDRGVILLIDQRYSYRHYASLLPKEWRPIRVRDTAQTNAALAAFWTS